MKTVVTFAALCGSLAVAALAQANIVAFDSMSGQPGSSWSIPSGGGSAASTGSRFMGMAINLAPGSNNTITGFDTTMVNNSGAAINFDAGWKVSLNYWIWNNWTQSTTAAPAFANLAGSGSVVFDFNAPTALGANGFFFFTGAASPGAGQVPPAAANPGVAINPVTVTGGGTIGITLNWTINRNDGAGFVLLGGLSSIVVGGPNAVAPTVGSNGFTAATGGYYRSAGAETDGNFLGTSSRNIGNNSAVMMRVYTLPTPGAVALLGLAGLVARRRR